MERSSPYDDRFRCGLYSPVVFDDNKLMYTYLFFDCDNTLLDFDQGERNAFSILCKELDIDPGSYPLYHTLNSECWKEFERGELGQLELRMERFRRFLPSTGTTASAQEASNLFLSALSTEGIPYPETKPMLTELRRRGYRLYLASNGIAFVQQGRYKACNLLSYVDGAFVSEEIGYQKPDPRFFDAVCKHEGITDKKQCVMIGDSLTSDIKGGKAAGIDTIWYRREGATKDDVIVPDRTITRLTELLELLPPRSPARRPAPDSDR
ncbi:MAG: YjjG family noncanonical pyrimidine nucleotidase [Sphaerochaetaceae bacterium]|jgi:putative hydrolase of the HAD superfamily